jgi:hypothetical protein
MARTGETAHSATTTAAESTIFFIPDLPGSSTSAISLFLRVISTEKWKPLFGITR